MEQEYGIEFPEGARSCFITVHWVHDGETLWKVPDTENITFRIGDDDTKYKLRWKLYSSSSHPGIYGYNTARSRVNLWRTIHFLRSNDAYVFYADTDSVVTDEVGKKLMEDAGLLGIELGQWKIEEESHPNNCAFVAPKAYTFNNSVYMKGRQKTSVRPIDKVGELLPRPTKFRSGWLRALEKRIIWLAVKFVESGKNYKRTAEDDQEWTKPLVINV